MFNTFNTELNLDFGMMTGPAWAKALNRITGDRLLVMTGGEPTLHPEFTQLCDGIEDRNIIVYSNISVIAMEKFLMLEKPVAIYASYHAAEEVSRDPENAFKEWATRVKVLSERGHNISNPHSPNDGSREVSDTPDFILKTRIEGDATIDGEFYSPYADDSRVKSKTTRNVICSTSQFLVAPDGTIWNCAAKMYSQRGEPIGHISTYDRDKIDDWVECHEYGQCHPCSQGKEVRFL